MNGGIKNCQLMIFTNEFPFGKREAFLEAEIEILSKYFENIVIVPSKSLPGKRSLPENVHINLTSTAEFKKILKWIVKTFFSFKLMVYILDYPSIIFNARKAKYLFKHVAAINVFEYTLPKVFEEIHPRLVYSYWFSPIVDVLVNEKKKYGFKLVSRTHGGDLYDDVSKLGFFPYRKQVIHCIDKIFSVSLSGQKYLKDRYGVNNVSLARLGTFDFKFTNSPSFPKQISILSVSNLIPLKRVDLIAESILVLSRLRTDMQIIWNHIGDGEHRESINQKIRLAKRNNVKFTNHGFLFNYQVMEFYLNNSIDLFINMSVSEGIPVSMMEAVSFGIPILATNVGGVSEIVSLENGKLLPIEADGFQIANSILDLLSKDLNRNSIRQVWKANYSAVDNYTRFAEQLKAV